MKPRCSPAPGTMFHVKPCGPSPPPQTLFRGIRPTPLRLASPAPPASHFPFHRPCACSPRASPHTQCLPTWPTPTPTTQLFPHVPACPPHRVSNPCANLLAPRASIPPPCFFCHHRARRRLPSPPAVHTQGSLHPTSRSRLLPTLLPTLQPTLPLAAPRRPILVSCLRAPCLRYPRWGLSSSFAPALPGQTTLPPTPPSRVSPHAAVAFPPTPVSLLSSHLSRSAPAHSPCPDLAPSSRIAASFHCIASPYPLKPASSSPSPPRTSFQPKPHAAWPSPEQALRHGTRQG